MTGELAPLFAPRGIVIVGASAAPGKLGTAMADALKGGRTPIALVNRSGGPEMVTTLEEATVSLATQGAVADLVISCVPASATEQVIVDAFANGIRTALICAGGFGEIGAAGMQFQSDLELAAQGHVRVLGPNTSGFFVPARGLRASFVPGAAHLKSGRVAVVASSGGVNHMLCFRLADAGVGISLGVGIGSGFDVNHAEVLDYLADDEATSVIALHLESVRNGVALLAAVRRASLRKPVVAFVVGRRTESAFAQSHTGSLATSWRTARSALTQAGAVIVDHEDQLIAAVSALSLVRLPPKAKAGVGLITAQAGPGLIIDDNAEADGWTLPTLTDRTRATIGELLPPMTFQANPVDTGRPGETFEQIVEAVADDDGIDLVAIYALTEPVLNLPEAVHRASASVPVLLAMDGAPDEVAQATGDAATYGLPFVQGPSTLSWAVDALVRDARLQHLGSDGESEPGERIDVSGGWDEGRSKRLLDSLGFVTPARRIVTDTPAAIAALAELGRPVAVKLSDAAVLHKTDIGGVHLGIATDIEMTAALEALRAIGATEFLIEKMAPPGVDLVVSVRRDPVFGPIALIGLGGTAAEVISDVSIATAPLSAAVAEAMVDDLRSRDLLFGWRGGPTLDRSELGRLVRALGSALSANPRLSEIEVNPLRLTESGLIALDAVVITVEEDASDYANA